MFQTFTIHHQQRLIGLDWRFLFAAVEVPEQAEFYVFNNIMGAPDAVRSGLPVNVGFEHHQGVWLPVFESEDTPENISAA